MYCLSCRVLLNLSALDRWFAPPQKFLCQFCIDTFSFLKSTSFGLSLFPYHARARHLIIESKIGSSYLHQQALMFFLCSHPEVEDLVRNAAFLVAAPSSFYSRIRGRFDLADLMVLTLQKKFGSKKQILPYRSFFKFSKRSKIKDRVRINLVKEKPFQSSKDYFLVVDDVITSGHTILKTCAYWPDRNAKYLTLACAS